MKIIPETGRVHQIYVFIDILSILLLFIYLLLSW
jgi:hypothetical protein